MSSQEKQYHHGDLKAAILDRAAEIIEAQGIEALSLRAIARDLGVSHGAPNRHFKTKSDLLAALATNGWEKITHATLQAAEDVLPQTPSNRLNAMGRGFLLWALQNKSAFMAVMHPDVERHVDDDLRQAINVFQKSVRDAVLDAQKFGRHPDIDPTMLTLYTNSVPFGLAMMLLNPVLGSDFSSETIDEKVAALIELVVPTTASKQM
jgi:AcrR family transcriptional regulator